MGVKKIKVKPMGDVPVAEVKPEVEAPKVEKTPEQKGAGAKKQWADPDKRARLQFGMKRWSSCGKPKKGTPEYKALLEETKRMLKDGSWKEWKPEAVVKG